jgi:hypothetical protein
MRKFTLSLGALSLGLALACSGSEYQEPKTISIDVPDVDEAIKAIEAAADAIEDADGDEAIEEEDAAKDAEDEGEEEGEEKVEEAKKETPKKPTPVNKPPTRLTRPGSDGNKGSGGKLTRPK